MELVENAVCTQEGKHVYFVKPSHVELNLFQPNYLIGRSATRSIEIVYRGGI